MKNDKEPLDGDEINLITLAQEYSDNDKARLPVNRELLGSYPQSDALKKAVDWTVGS